MKGFKPMSKISIIVPCYNEQQSLPLFYKEIKAVFEGIKYDYELLLINDGSKDDTLSVMRDLAKEDKNMQKSGGINLRFHAVPYGITLPQKT